MGRILMMQNGLQYHKKYRIDATYMYIEKTEKKV